MLQVLLDSGVKPDMIVGSSAGAINGAYLANDPTSEGVEKLQELWGRTAEIPILGNAGHWGINLLRGREGAVANGVLSTLINTELNYQNIEDAQIPLHIITTHLDSGTPIWHGTGPLKDTILASCAIPGVFPPVTLDVMDERWRGKHIDGGVTELVPVGHALKLNPKEVWVLDVAGAARHTQSYHPATLDLVATGFAMALATQQGSLQESLEDERVNFITLRMNTRQRLSSILDFSHSLELIELGKREAEEIVALNGNSNRPKH
jgi:NTE family protein